MLRLFVAIGIPGEVRSALRVFLNELREIAPHAKWVRAENLHVTLKFLGETEPERLGAVQVALSSIRSAQSIRLQFRGLSFFPNEERPRVFWVGMETSANLKMLASEIDCRLHKLGFPREDRPFTPHLTLARFHPLGLPPELASAGRENASREFGSFTTDKFHLIESKLKPSGAEYTTVQSFPFVSET